VGKKKKDSSSQIRGLEDLSLRGTKLGKRKGTDEPADFTRGEGEKRKREKKSLATPSESEGETTKVCGGGSEN